MKTLIISTSITGNNDALAVSIAKELKADHIKVNNPNKVNFGIIMKHLFNMSPKVNPNIIDKYDYIIFCAPIWMGKPLVTIKPYLTYLKNKTQNYSFITLCGGKNINLEDKITKIVGKKPRAFIEYYITSLFPDNKSPEIKDVMNYKVNGEEIKLITEKVIKKII